ncbi:cysteine-rich repeat secretory protein 38-like [Diospyros lotus]|uniref:cysteine-rich repeat secretory protein 38-like n=1 Tax=Diospyros lotus TaxID=55363 RepID=UPI002258AFAD|nr:cysteine-rich repeat secretory protein 38-like [Diospyros lotus]
MHFSKPLIPFWLSFCLFFFPTTVLCAGPLYRICFGSNSSSAIYQSNVNDLGNLLQDKVAQTGFAVASVGNGENRANGLALCRGDTSSLPCKTCVAEASKRLRDRCPTREGAIIWYDNCLYKYSNEEFFGDIDKKHKFYMVNTEDVKDPEVFNMKTKNLLSQLVSKAYVNPMLYAADEVELDESKKLYGLVQCTRDLSRSNCKKCLEDAVDELLDCCDGKEGGRVVGGSCNFRYEIYPFLNN